MSNALQRTVRRVGAVLVLQLGVISAQLFTLQPTRETIATFVSLPLAVCAGLYLLGSGLRSLVGVKEEADRLAPDEH
ncbi:hypothetical protein [Haloglomus litoreum]|uniref:hypothetical protein n=1 Tax=Haloglomus litoreum TaxID=3034026 RepID=UPI0023E80968|nr:hypothetical protein [Haloglomus sp. DT116]